MLNTVATFLAIIAVFGSIISLIYSKKVKRQIVDCYKKRNSEETKK